jgi:hypothetical protein
MIGVVTTLVKVAPPSEARSTRQHAANCTVRRLELAQKEHDGTDAVTPKQPPCGTARPHRRVVPGAYQAWAAVSEAQNLQLQEALQAQHLLQLLAPLNPQLLQGSQAAQVCMLQPCALRDPQPLQRKPSLKLDAPQLGGALEHYHTLGLGLHRRGASVTAGKYQSNKYTLRTHCSNHGKSGLKKSEELPHQPYMHERIGLPNHTCHPVTVVGLQRSAVARAHAGSWRHQATSTDAPHHRCAGDS